MKIRKEKYLTGIENLMKRVLMMSKTKSPLEISADHFLHSPSLPLQQHRRQLEGIQRENLLDEEKKKTEASHLLEESFSFLLMNPGEGVELDDDLRREEHHANPHRLSSSSLSSPSSLHLLHNSYDEARLLVYDKRR